MAKSTFRLIIFFVLLSLLFPLPAYNKGLVPCGGPDERECTACDLLVLVQNVMNFVLKAAFIICIVLIIYGGFRWMFSFGNQSNISLGQKVIVSAIFGLIIVLASWIIVNTILWFLSPKIEGVDIKSSWFKLECYPSEGGGGGGTGITPPISPRIK